MQERITAIYVNWHIIKISYVTITKKKGRLEMYRSRVFVYY